MASAEEIRRKVAEIVAVMRAGGYYEAVMSAGPELDRVKRFLRIFAGEAPPVKAPAKLGPEILPVFPGLSAEPFTDLPRSHPAPGVIREHFARVRAEGLALGRNALMEREDNELADEKAKGPRRRRSLCFGWRIFPLHICGTALPTAEACPSALEMIAKIPGNALRWPFGYVMYSVMGPRTHLNYHRSPDMLRLRCHLGVDVPPGCALQVAGRSRPWREGRGLFFNNAFWHASANKSDRPRMILIFDLWHPGLTPAEIAALEAGFRKSQVRRIFYGLDLEDMLEDPGLKSRADAVFLPAFEREDAEPAVRDFWKPGY